MPNVLLDGAADRAGAVVFVCAVAADTLDGSAYQLDEAGDALVIAVAVADQLVYESRMARSP